MKNCSYLSMVILFLWLIISPSLSQITFVPHTIAGGDNAARGAISVCAIDLDGDGDTDAVSGSYEDHKIAWYENIGDEFFKVHIVTQETFWVSRVKAVDFDGDNDVDLMATQLLTIK